MSNKVYIEIKETRLHQIAVDLDLHDESVAKAYKKQDADFFGDWVDDAENTYIEYEWG